MEARPRQRLTVWAGGEKLWIAASSIVEVTRAPRMTRTPRAPECLLGVAHHRGELLPVVSTSDLLGLGRARFERVVVLGRGAPVGLAVEAVGALESFTPISSEGDRRRVLENEDGTDRLDLDEALLAQFGAASPRARDSRRAEADGPTGAPPSQMSTRSFLSFWVSGQIYALPLEDVREVANAGDGLNALGVAPTHVELRGARLPLVALGRMLGLADSAGGSRLIVIGEGDRARGMLVDRIGAVIRLDDVRVGKAPRFFNRRDGQALIASVLRMPDGRGVVSVLSLEALIGGNRARPVLASGDRLGSSRAPEPIPVERSKRVLVLAAGGQLYGLPMEVVREVIRRPARLARPPRSPANLEGVISHRGRVLPVIRDWQGERVRGEPARMVVVSIGGTWTGLLADRVIGAVDASSRAGSAPGALFQGDFDHEGMAVPLICPDALKHAAEVGLARYADRGTIVQ